MPCHLMYDWLPVNEQNYGKRRILFLLMAEMGAKMFQRHDFPIYNLIIRLAHFKKTWIIIKTVPLKKE